MEATFSFKDAGGNWKDNTLYHKSPKGCSSFKHLMGTSWTAIMNGLGMENVTCPIPPGIYTATGMDTSLLSNTNIPKTFVYGTYKIRLYYTIKKEVYSCNILIIEFKPV
uniref:MD-2-related lipid-recognition domain-containing protein n=1 Tax=Schizaphis graminum TaxID=13262 RepID=A0A2S2NQB8_SCHGA